MKQGNNSISSSADKNDANAKNSSGAAANNISSNRWSELVITKSPRIATIAVGHEGQHAILVSDEGSAFFVGTAKRGEDGDSSKYLLCFLNKLTVKFNFLAE